MDTAPKSTATTLAQKYARSEDYREHMGEPFDSDALITRWQVPLLTFVVFLMYFFPVVVIPYIQG